MHLPVLYTVKISFNVMALWPSGLRRAFQVRILIGVGSNPINVMILLLVKIFLLGLMRASGGTSGCPIAYARKVSNPVG